MEEHRLAQPGEEAVQGTELMQGSGQAHAAGTVDPFPPFRPWWSEQKHRRGPEASQGYPATAAWGLEGPEGASQHGHKGGGPGGCSWGRGGPWLAAGSPS